jgi:hypothetical protein
MRIVWVACLSESDSFDISDLDSKRFTKSFGLMVATVLFMLVDAVADGNVPPSRTHDECTVTGK